MILIALIAVAAAVVRTFPTATVLILAAIILVLPSLLITEIRANQRRRRGQPMSGGERAASVIQVTVACPFLLFSAVKIGSFIHSAFLTFISR
jgi:type III secretory pathway component EscV